MWNWKNIKRKLVIAFFISAFFNLGVSMYAFTAEDEKEKTLAERIADEIKKEAKKQADAEKKKADKKKTAKAGEEEKDPIKKLPKSIEFEKKYLGSIESGIKVLEEKEFAELSIEAKPISYIEVDGTINPGSASFIETSILHAQKDGHQAIIIRMDTPGGLLSSTRDIIRYISDSKIPVVVFVHPGGARATSAGAIIGIASHALAMSPGTNIGAAAPVAAGKNLEGDLAKKAKNDTAAMVKAQAVLRGRNPKLAELVVRESVSLTAKEAFDQKLIDYTPNDINELLRALHRNKVKIGEAENSFVVLNTTGLTSANLVKLKMNASQKFLHIVANPNISTMLMALGGMALYAEISSGFTLIFPGIFGLVCLILAFVSLQTLPVNVGGLILFGLGMVLIAAEAFVSSFGLLSLGGLISLGLGALFLVDVTQTDIQVSMSLIGPMLASFAIIAAGISYMVAKDRRGGSVSFDPLLHKDATIKEVSEDGKSGSAFVQGEIWKFKSEESFAVGDIAKVQKQEGMLIYLKK